MNYKINQINENHLAVCQHQYKGKKPQPLNLPTFHLYIYVKACHVLLALYRNFILNDRLYILLNYRSESNLRIKLVLLFDFINMVTKTLRSKQTNPNSLTSNNV